MFGSAAQDNNSSGDSAQSQDDSQLPNDTGLNSGSVADLSSDPMATIQLVDESDSVGATVAAPTVEMSENNDSGISVPEASPVSFSSHSPQSTIDLNTEPEIELVSTDTDTLSMPEMAASSDETPAIDQESPSQISIEPNIGPMPTESSLPVSVGDKGSGKTDILTILKNKGLLTDDQINDVRFTQIQSGQPFDNILRDKAYVSEEEVFKAKAELNNIPFIEIKSAVTSPEAMAFIPQPLAERYKVLPIDYNKETNELSLAMADPLDLEAVQFIEKKTRTTVRPFAAIKSELEMTIKERYGVSLSSEVKQVLKETDLGKGVGVQEAGVTQVSGVIREAPITKIVSYVLEYAVKTRASDIHIEPQEERTRIRYRIDGILQEKLVLPKKVHDALVSRIKIMCNMKIDEKRIPQDGRFNFSNAEQEVDLRVSTLPTVFGEKVVMRLLKKSGGAATFAELGLRGKALQNVEEVIRKPHGIILVTGPTGSGKTTTLYSVLTKLNTPKVNIMTLEDPVEYQMDGVNQVQINPQVGLTFASGLRSFLRQDPNIIMVGEIRDSETAELAIQASLTGHLVLSTLHTNSASGAPPRLLDMGAEPFLLASTISAVVGQRVARKICTNCKKQFEPSPEVLKNIKEVLGNLFPTDKKVMLSKGEGCQQCGNSGYLGRVGIYEVLMITEKIGRLILERRPAIEVEHESIKDGMIIMKQDGYLKVVEGLTTIEEVLRVAEI